MKDRVETIQSRFFKARNVAMDALVELVAEIKQARLAGVPKSELAAAWNFQRKAQLFLDLVGRPKNSTGFHAPQEAMRILTESVDFSRRGQLAVRNLKILQNAPLNTAQPTPQPAALR
jgi:nitrite reductase (cytochrome c-552)